MNKTIAILIGAVIVIGGAAFVITRGSDNNSVKVINSSTGKSQEIKTDSSALVSVDACEVLTDSVAKQILGENAQKGDTQSGNASSSDVSVSNCVYTVKTVTTGSVLEQARSTEAVGVLARAAKSQTGADSNKSQFASAKPSGVQDVSGYGDKAFWNPKFGQLNILKANNWYIVSHYKGLNATEGTLDQAKQLADAINGNLR